MYDIAVRKLALIMVADLGVLKSSVFTNISRSTQDGHRGGCETAVCVLIECVRENE